MRALFISGFPFDMPSVRYRCFHPQEQLAMLGWKTDVVWVGEPAIRLNHDIIVFHQVILDEYVERIVERARTAGCVLIYDMDDLTVGADFVRHQAYKHGFDAKQMLALIETTRRREALLRLCDACLVSTDYLATIVATYGVQPHILRNALGQRDIEIAATVKRREVALGDRIVLGYMSGTASHNYDFAEIGDVLVEIMNRYPQVYLQVTRPLEIPETLCHFGHRVRRLPLVPWEHLYGILASLDINLAPLELGEPFCLAKSEVKYIEAGLVGVPTVAAATSAFRYAITDGENGLLAASTQDWYQALTCLIENPELIKKLGGRAQEDVLVRYHPRTRAKDLRGALEHIIQTAQRAQPEQRDAQTSLLVRSDLGIPFDARPPFFALNRRAIVRLLRLAKRAVQYEGLGGAVRHFVQHCVRKATTLFRWLNTAENGN